MVKLPGTTTCVAEVALRGRPHDQQAELVREPAVLLEPVAAVALVTAMAPRPRIRLKLEKLGSQATSPARPRITAAAVAAVVGARMVVPVVPVVAVRVARERLVDPVLRTLAAAVVVASPAVSLVAQVDRAS